jgi:hypothetical protein
VKRRKEFGCEEKKKESWLCRGKMKGDRTREKSLLLVFILIK